jgi:hypothetical protein
MSYYPKLCGYNCVALKMVKIPPRGILKPHPEMNLLVDIEMPEKRS